MSNPQGIRNSRMRARPRVEAAQAAANAGRRDGASVMHSLFPTGQRDAIFGGQEFFLIALNPENTA
jgi:hypothetical protein